MRFASFRHQDRAAAGIVMPSGILDLGGAAQRCGESQDLSPVLAIIRGGEAAHAACERLAARAARDPSELIALPDVELLAPIDPPVRNAFCVGRNYLDHVKEGFAARSEDMKLPQAPQFFTKATHAV